MSEQSLQPRPKKTISMRTGAAITSGIAAVSGVVGYNFGHGQGSALPNTRWGVHSQVAELDSRLTELTAKAENRAIEDTAKKIENREPVTARFGQAVVLRLYDGINERRQGTKFLVMPNPIVEKRIVDGTIEEVFVARTKAGEFVSLYNNNSLNLALGDTRYWDDHTLGGYGEGSGYLSGPNGLRFGEALEFETDIEDPEAALEAALSFAEGIINDQSQYSDEEVARARTTTLEIPDSSTGVKEVSPPTSR